MICLIIMTHTCAINRNPILHLAIGYLPNRVKRIFFLTSLAAIAKETKEPDAQMLHKLNTMLNLASTGDNALKVPIVVSELIWTHKDLIAGDICLLSKSCSGSPFILESAERIVEAIPDWFLYDEKEEVVQDILNLFTADEELFPSAIKAA